MCVFSYSLQEGVQLHPFYKTRHDSIWIVDNNLRIVQLATNLSINQSLEVDLSDSFQCRRLPTELDTCANSRYKLLKTKKRKQMASSTIVCPRDNDITVLPSSANPEGEISTGPCSFSTSTKKKKNAQLQKNTDLNLHPFDAD